MKIWAHRGCSQQYPENTMLAFSKAAELQKLTGIELDVQLTKDGELVVIHDERVDRTTEGIGYVKDYNWKELQRLHIYADTYPTQKIPILEEVLEMLEKPMKAGLKLNIELKTGVFPYLGIEDKVINLVYKKGLEGAVLYSSFYGKSLERMRRLDSRVELGILDTRVSDCVWKVKGGCGATALHPYWQAIDMTKEELNGYTVRAWFTGHLYPEKPTGTLLEMKVLENKGITDVFINEPEAYIY